MEHLVRAEHAAIAHGFEQPLELVSKLLWRHVHAHDPFKQSCGQQVHVLGEEAEEALAEEVGRLGRRHARSSQPIGGLGKGARGLLGDFAVGLAGLEARRFGEQPSQLELNIRPAQVFEPDDVALARVPREVGMNLDAKAIADHQ